MEVYAADICRLVKEAFPDFEQNASEYMRLSRFLAGLDQELQIKCHERGVKTFKEAFQVATQAERARTAAKLIQPVSSSMRENSMAQSVNAISDTNTLFLKQAVVDLTNTVKDLSKDVSALKLQLYDQRSRSQTPSPHRHSSMRHASPTRYATECSGSSGRFQPNILMHILHHLASTEDLPAVAETFTDNGTTHTSIMTEWISHRTVGRGLRITILQNTPLQPTLATM